MNTPNNKRSRDTDEAIIRAAFQVMIEKKKPVSKITVREICELAEINRSTFYAHYMDVYDLFEKVEQHMAQMCADTILNSYAAGSGFQAAIEGMFGYVLAYKDFYQLYFSELSHTVRILTLMIEPFKNQLEQFWDSDFGYKVEGEVSYHFNFFTAGMAALIARWLDNGCKESPHQLYEILLREYGPDSLLNTWSGGQAFPDQY